MTRKEYKRIMSKTLEPNGKGCWNWKGAKVSDEGYGIIRYRGSNTLVHRLMYELFKGEIKYNLVVDHICNNPSCINPSHLQAITQKENLDRSSLTLSSIAKAKISCVNGHLLEGENLKIDQGKRRCATCKREKAKQRYHIIVGGQKRVKEEIYGVD